MTVMTKRDEQWESCFIEYFLIEICLGVDTIQTKVIYSFICISYIFAYLNNLMTRILNLNTTRDCFLMFLKYPIYIYIYIYIVKRKYKQNLLETISNDISTLFLEVIFL